MRKLLFIILLCCTTQAFADAYDKLWQKAQKAQKAGKPEVAFTCVNKIYERALGERNAQQLTRALYAYDALAVALPEERATEATQLIWEARCKERNSTEHALFTHMLGRITHNESMVALSVADTALLLAQPTAALLPMAKGRNLLEVFGQYIRQHNIPVAELLTTETMQPTPEEPEAPQPQKPGKHKAKAPAGEVKLPPTTGSTTPYDKKSSHRGKERVTPTPTQPKGEKPATPAPQKVAASTSVAPAPAEVKLPALTGAYATYVFNVPGGISRTCLVETKSGRPVKHWKMHRTDGRGGEQDFVADGNGHVWQRRSNIHDRDGLYDWSLKPVVADDGSVNTLKAHDFHSREGWSSGETNSKELWLDIQKEDRQRGLVSVTVRAPHRNLVLMRDITSGGRLIEQRQYAFSDFIHFDLQWREAYGSEALVTFAYVLDGHLYTTSLTLSAPAK